MAKIDASKIWSLNYRLLSSIIANAAHDIDALGLDVKAFFVLADIDECPHPAKIAERLSMPKPTVTVYLKSLEAAGFVRREIDAADLRRHLLIVTPKGRKVMIKGQTIFSDAYDTRLARLKPGERAELQKLLEKLS